MTDKDLDYEVEDKKELYSYQQGDIDAIFERLENAPKNHHLLYQLPTGGGNTVIFSEIVRRYLSKYNKKLSISFFIKSTSCQVDECPFNQNEGESSLL